MMPIFVVRSVFARSGGECEAAIVKVCSGSATQLHHRKNRSQRGGDTVVNLLHLCHACHHLITIHAPGTGDFRTKSHQPEGYAEDGHFWTPKNKSEGWVHFGAKPGSTPCGGRE